MKKLLEIKAKKLRLKGYSLKELHRMLGVSKSTISTWIQGIQLSDKAQARLRKNYTNGQLAAMKTIREKTRQKNIIADNFALKLFEEVNLSSEIALLFCALIYQCEGSKSIKDSVTFTNSDPDLIKTFLFLFRKSFTLDKKRMKILMHLHKYHDEKIQKEFWSKVTGVPKEQFNRTYLKPNSGKYKKEGYQGCIQVRYGDVAIGRKLKAVAKMFMERYK
jgi:transcriptional regulator with XRE-family HTH domain